MPALQDDLSHLQQNIANADNGFNGVNGGDDHNDHNQMHQNMINGVNVGDYHHDQNYIQQNMGIGVNGGDYHHGQNYMPQNGVNGVNIGDNHDDQNYMQQDIANPVNVQNYVQLNFVNDVNGGDYHDNQNYVQLNVVDGANGGVNLDEQNHILLNVVNVVNGGDDHGDQNDIQLNEVNGANGGEHHDDQHHMHLNVVNGMNGGIGDNDQYHLEQNMNNGVHSINGINSGHNHGHICMLVNVVNGVIKAEVLNMNNGANGINGVNGGNGHDQNYIQMYVDAGANGGVDFPQEQPRETAPGATQSDDGLDLELGTERSQSELLSRIFCLCRRLLFKLAKRLLAQPLSQHAFQDVNATFAAVVTYIIWVSISESADYREPIMLPLTIFDLELAYEGDPISAPLTIVNTGVDLAKRFLDLGVPENQTTLNWFLALQNYLQQLKKSASGTGDTPKHGERPSESDRYSSASSMSDEEHPSHSLQKDDEQQPATAAGAAVTRVRNPDPPTAGESLLSGDELAALSVHPQTQSAQPASSEDPLAPEESSTGSSHAETGTSSQGQSDTSTPPRRPRRFLDLFLQWC